MRPLLTALLLAPLAALHAADLLPLTPDSANQLDRAQKADLIEIAPVHLPPPDAGDCNHYGWPIATMTGATPSSSNPLRPRAFGGKGAEGMKKGIPSNRTPSDPGPSAGREPRG